MIEAMLNTSEDWFKPGDPDWTDVYIEYDGVWVYISFDLENPHETAQIVDAVIEYIRVPPLLRKLKVEVELENLCLDLSSEDVDRILNFPIERLTWL